MQRDTGNTESITVEYGFLDSAGDDINQLKNNWQNYAEAVVRAITQYLNLTYVPIEESNYYTVKSGDSLWSIAKKYNILVNNLKKANGISSNTLSIGQILKIPNEEEKKVDTNSYIVKKGDTLYKIAQENSTSIGELIQLNNLTNTNLNIGDILKLPTKSFNTYVVKKGDSLYKIAINNNTTIDNIKELNNLNNNILYIGQILKLPSNINNTYTVKKGDSLYKIARENNTTVNNLMSLNNLSSIILSIGQVLKLK